MGYIYNFSYVTGAVMCSWVTFTVLVMLRGWPVFMGYINYFSYVTGVGMCSWVTLTFSVMLLGLACVHGLHLLFQLCYWGRRVFMVDINY